MLFFTRLPSGRRHIYSGQPVKNVPLQGLATFTAVAVGADGARVQLARCVDQPFLYTKHRRCIVECCFVQILSLSELAVPEEYVGLFFLLVSELADRVVHGPYKEVLRILERRRPGRRRPGVCEPAAVGGAGQTNIATDLGDA